MPTEQGTDDFNHPIDAGYYTDGFFGAPTAVSSPLYQSQPKSLSIVTDGGNVGARHNITGSPTFGWAAFPFRSPSTPTVGYAVHSFGTAIGQVPAIFRGTTGLYTTIGGNNGTEFPISNDTWYWVETICDLSSSTLTIYMRIEGTDAASASVGASATTVSWSQLISFAGDETGQTSFYGLWKWGSAASITDWLGVPTPSQNTFLRPSVVI